MPGAMPMAMMETPSLPSPAGGKATGRAIIGARNTPFNAARQFRHFEKPTSPSRAIEAAQTLALSAV